jgi:hypothetical protein
VCGIRTNQADSLQGPPDLLGGEAAARALR